MSGQPTGQELHDRLAEAAAAQGVALYRFVEPICGDKHASAWLLMLRKAIRPRAYTITRVEALLAGEDIPQSPHAAQRQELAATRRDNPSFIHVAGRKERIDNPPAPVDRDPCWKCGTRADIGCKHRQAWA